MVVVFLAVESLIATVPEGLKEVVVAVAECLMEVVVTQLSWVRLVVVVLVPEFVVEQLGNFAAWPWFVVSVVVLSSVVTAPPVWGGNC